MHRDKRGLGVAANGQELRVERLGEQFLPGAGRALDEDGTPRESVPVDPPDEIHRTREDEECRRVRRDDPLQGRLRVFARA